MKILVTGGAGFIGSHLVDHLLREGHEVKVYDNLSGGNRDFLKHHEKNKRFAFVKADLADRKTLRKESKKIEMVFHLAANSDISKGISDPSLDFEQTTHHTFNLLQAMKENGVKKIFFTSGSGIYGDVGSTYTKENFGPLIPVSMYGATKLSAEAMIFAFSNFFDIQVWVLRPANIIGPRLTHGVVFDFVKRLKKDSKKLQILGDGRQSKSYLYVLDVIRAIDLVTKKAKQKINIFNIASNSFITVNSIADVITKEMNINPKRSWTGGKIGWKGDVAKVRINNSKITKLGWKPKYNSRQAVQKTVRVVLGKDAKF
ncbi:MAG: SDR family NAD(P)-dependent oxidoreductase [Candidatus Moranbacteria bacterium]|nr:SDR family NAD(P)-dependent oxidoreductase [Candidatus Moranbacteria bacterium]